MKRKDSILNTIKFYIRSGIHPYMWIAGGLFFAAIITINILEHNLPGAEKTEYASRLGATGQFTFIIIMLFTLGSLSLYSSRFAYSTPFAKKLFTTAPIIVINGIMLLYFLTFIVAEIFMGMNTAVISDILILYSSDGIIAALAAVLFNQLKWLYLFGVIFPIGFDIWAGKSEVLNSSGFGVSLPIAVLISVGALAVSVIIEYAVLNYSWNHKRGNNLGKTANSYLAGSR